MMLSTYEDARRALGVGDQIAIVAALPDRVRELPPHLAELALPARLNGRQMRFRAPCCGLPRPGVCLVDVRGRLPGHTFVGDCCWTRWVREGSIVNGAPMTIDRWRALAAGTRTEAAAQ